MVRLWVLLPALASALPQNPEIVNKILRAGLTDEFLPCNETACIKPQMKYESIQKSQPGIQWMDHGGYCGSWAIQRAILAKGAWISQQQVRDHASPAQGAPASHDNEILSNNIDAALKSLKINATGFDYRTMPTPQQSAYFAWLKKQLVAGNTAVWMIMWSGDSYPAYNMKLPSGVHGHVEPIIGIQSNHPLTDETVYDDDVIVHYDDAGFETYYDKVGTLSGDWAVGQRARCHSRSYCIGPYSYGWAMQGFLDTREGLPLSLSIDPWQKEPEPREGGKPNQITGTLTVEGLTKGAKYDIYRWDTTDEAFTYTDKYKKTSFTATNDTYVVKDPTTFSSDSATYYRCVKATGSGVTTVV